MNFRISGIMFESLCHHLFPGDGLEAIAFALCGRFNGQKDSILLVHKLHLIPHQLCERAEDRITWPTELIDPILEEAEKKNLSIVKFHCHPGGFHEFSQYDDSSDKSVFDTIYSWGGLDGLHASVVVLPDGDMFGRIIMPDLTFEPIGKFMVAGIKPKLIIPESNTTSFQTFELRNRQTFGDKTVQLLQQLKIAVIGCSGTGSPVIEQLVRLGVGELVLVDPKRVEHKNLNRIYGTTNADANQQRYKVHAIKDHIDRIGLGTKVTPCPVNLYDSKEALEDVISSDFLIGCVDSITGRNLLNHISTFYLAPLIDMGVSLRADGNNGISEILGGIHYIEPGGSSLRTRGVYTDKMLFDISMKEQMPEEYENQLKEGYVKNANVDSPAVISVNSLVASLAVNELLARLHPFRFSDNSRYSSTHLNLSDWEIFTPAMDSPIDTYLSRYVGRGTMVPLMNLHDLDPK